MKAITESNLMEFAWAIAESCTNTEEYFSFLFNEYAEKVYHAWTNDDIARKALEMVEEKPKTIDIADIEKYRDELVDFLIDSEDFDIEEVGDKFADAWDASEIGVNWETVKWAIAEIHTIDDLIEIVQEAITEAKNNDDNVE